MEDWQSAPAINAAPVSSALPDWQQAPAIGKAPAAQPPDDTGGDSTPAPSASGETPDWQQAPPVLGGHFGGSHVAESDALWNQVYNQKIAEAAQGNTQLTDYNNAFLRNMARPVEGAIGLVAPQTAEDMRRQNDYVYATRQGSAGTNIGGFVGSAAQTPLALSPVGRVISAAEAAGNSRVNTVESRNRGNDVGGVGEFVNAAGSGALDYGTNKVAAGLLANTVGSVGKAIAPAIADAAVKGDTSAVTNQLVKAMAARIGVEALGNDAIGRAHTLAQNLVNRVTNDPQQRLMNGQGWENEVNATLQTLLFTGIAGPHSIAETKAMAADRAENTPALTPEQKATAAQTLYPKGKPADWQAPPPVSDVPTPPDAATLESLKTATENDNVPTDQGQPAHDENAAGVQQDGQGTVPEAQSPNEAGNEQLPPGVEGAKGGESPQAPDTGRPAVGEEAGSDGPGRGGQTGRSLLDNATPKFRVTDGPESKGIDLDFDNPDDKALYLATVPRKGKVASEAADYLQTERGYGPADIEHAGQALRDRVEGMADGHDPDVPLRISDTSPAPDMRAPRRAPVDVEPPAPSSDVEMLPGKSRPEVAADNQPRRTQDDETLESANKGAYRITSGLEGHQEFLDVHRELTGQDAVPYAGGRGRGFRSDGKTFFNVEQNNTPQLQREAIAHEATHALQDTRPDLVHALNDAIPLATREKLLTEYQTQYQRQEGKPLDAAQNDREIQAMAVGRAFSRSGVAREVMQNDPGIFRRGADAMITKLRGLTSGGQLTNEIVKFLRTAREQAATNRPATPGGDSQFLPSGEYDETSRKRDNDALEHQMSGSMARGEMKGNPDVIPERAGPVDKLADYRRLKEWAKERGVEAPEVTGRLEGTTPKTYADVEKARPEGYPAEQHYNDLKSRFDAEQATGEKQPLEFLPGGKAVKTFNEEDVKPRLEAASEAVGKAWEGTKELFGLQNTDDAMRAKGILRERGSELANRMDRLVDAFRPAKEAFDKVPVADQRQFIDDMEKGKPQTNPKLQPIADALRGILDDRLKQVQSRGKLQNFIQDYFPHLWKNPKKAGAVFSGEGRSPFEGRKSFLKQRSLPLLSDGIAKGLEPITENPVEATMLRVREMDKFITAHDALEEMKKPVGPNGPQSPLLQRVPARGAPPDGYSKINDSVGTIYAPPNRKGGTSIAGYWVAPDAVASVVNNNLSPGLRGDEHFGGLFRGYLTAGNIVNQSTLGLSAFHAATSVFNSAMSEFGMGTKALFAGRAGEAAKRYGNSLTMAGPAARDFYNGTSLLREWKKPGSTTPEMAALVSAMKAGGGRAGMDTFYHTGMTDKMMTAFRQGNVIGGAMRLPMAGLEQAAKPIMEYLVPRLKMGAFMQMAQHEMAGNPNMSHAELRSKMGDVWNSVDNRFGQMVQDNVFWNRTVKDLAMASTRSVGWNLGTFRELGGGIKDFTTMGKRLAMDRNFSNVEMTHRMAYTTALPVLSGLVGGLIHYAFTGTPPKELKDLYYPKNGGKDANGDDTRMALPTYMKDVYSFKNNPVGTITNKMHPMLSTVLDMLANKDFYGTKIRNEDDPIMKQVAGELKFIGKSTAPISVMDTIKNVTEGKGAGGVLPLVGLTNAPGYINKSPAENLAAELEAERLPRGSRTQAQVDKSHAVHSLAELVRNHDSTASAKIRAAIQSGQIGVGDNQQIKQDAKQPNQLAANVSRLDVPAAMKVWDEASDEEKKTIGPPLFKKVRGSKALSRDERVGYMQALQADWNRLKGVPGGPQ